MSNEDGISGRVERPALWRVLIPPFVTAAVLVLAYFLLPFTGAIEPRTVVVLVIGALAVGAVFAWQLRRVLRADNPLARGMEGLAVVFGLYLVGFATVYFMLSQLDSSNFNEPLTRLDALYFCVSVFATVGFGDIVADSQTARAVVLVQMVGNLILIGVALRLFTMAVGVRRRQLGRVSDTRNPLS